MIYNNHTCGKKVENMKFEYKKHDFQKFLALKYEQKSLADSNLGPAV